MKLASLVLEACKISCFSAFRHTIAKWPCLGGMFCVSRRDPKDIRLCALNPIHYRHWAGQYMNSSLENKQNGATQQGEEANHEELSNMITETEDQHFDLGSIREAHFLWRDPHEGKQFRPVSMRLSVERGHIILGFQFSENIFDTASINNFLRLFAKRVVKSQYKHAPVSSRYVPAGSSFNESFAATLTSHDWKPGFVEMPTPRSRLICKVLSLPGSEVHAIREEVLEEFEGASLKIRPPMRDFTLAIFWLYIMRARHLNDRFDTQETARLNINVPSASHVDPSHDPEGSYFGNSTVTTTALLSGEHFALNPKMEFLDAFLEVSAKDWALLAFEIRAAIEWITKEYVEDITAMKQAITGTMDRHAQLKASRLHTTTLTFEDWTDLGRDVYPNLPCTKTWRPMYFPSPHHMEEGTIIILPRESGDHGITTENWAVCVCLEEDDMMMLEDLLKLANLTVSENTEQLLTS